MVVLAAAAVTTLVGWLGFGWGWSPLLAVVFVEYLVTRQLGDVGRGLRQFLRSRCGLATPRQRGVQGDAVGPGVKARPPRKSVKVLPHL